MSLKIGPHVSERHAHAIRQRVTPPNDKGCRVWIGERNARDNAPVWRTYVDGKRKHVDARAYIWRLPGNDGMVPLLVPACGTDGCMTRTHQRCKGWLVRVNGQWRYCRDGIKARRYSRSLETSS
jgi:hypothetical protein